MFVVQVVLLGCQALRFVSRCIRGKKNRNWLLEVQQLISSARQGCNSEIMGLELFEAADNIHHGGVCGGGGEGLI